MKLDSKAKKIAATIVAVGVTALAVFGGYTLIRNMVNDNPNSVVTTDNTPSTQSPITTDNGQENTQKETDTYNIFKAYTNYDIIVDTNEFNKAFPIQQLSKLMEEKNIPNAYVLCRALEQSDELTYNQSKALIEGFKEMISNNRHFQGVQAQQTWLDDFQFSDPEEFAKLEEEYRITGVVPENDPTYIKYLQEQEQYEQDQKAIEEYNTEIGVIETAIIMKEAGINNLTQLTRIMNEKEIEGSKDMYIITDCYAPGFEDSLNYSLQRNDYINLDVFNDYFNIDRLSQFLQEKNIHSAEELLSDISNSEYGYSYSNYTLDKINEAFKGLDNIDTYYDYDNVNNVLNRDEILLFKDQTYENTKYYKEHTFRTNIGKLLCIFDKYNINTLDNLEEIYKEFNIDTENRLGETEYYDYGMGDKGLE